MGLESWNGVNTKPRDGMWEIKVTVKLHLAILPGVGGTVTRACGLASLGLILSVLKWDWIIQIRDTMHIRTLACSAWWRWTPLPPPSYKAFSLTVDALLSFGSQIFVEHLPSAKQYVTSKETMISNQSPFEPEPGSFTQLYSQAGPMHLWISPLGWSINISSSYFIPQTFPNPCCVPEPVLMATHEGWVRSITPSTSPIWKCLKKLGTKMKTII